MVDDRSEKQHPTLLNTWLDSIMSHDTFTQLCVDVYFSDTYSYADLLILTGRLLPLFTEAMTAAMDPVEQQTHKANEQLCKIALESTITALPMRLPSNMITIHGLFLAVSPCCRQRSSLYR